MKPHIYFPTFSKSLEIKQDFAKFLKYEKKEALKKKKADRKAQIEKLSQETELHYQLLKKELEEKKKKYR